MRGYDLPGLHRPGIQVHEIRFGVVSNATCMQLDRQFADPFGLVAGDPDVNGPTLHVETVFGDTRRRFSQGCIGLR